jgi:hypothetical protein
MKAGAENRKKTIAAGALGAVALVCIFIMYNSFFGGTSAAPPPTVAPINPSAHATNTTAGPTQATTPALGNAAHTSIPGVDAVKLASTSASLDPTLDETAMHRTENLVYSGTGRNIFSLTYTPPPPPMPTGVPKPRPKPITLTPAPVGPPPPPPINLKFFGTAKRANGPLQAFLLQGDNVYLASAGEIVAHKYRIVSINLNSIQVEDLQYNNTQTLQLQMQ